ncbi:hypothetical protein UlMin_040763 [Ulmus minor]
MSSIPVFDLKELADSDSSEDEYKKLREACEEWGCFRIVNHNIPLDLMREMKSVVKSLFELPTQVKKKNSNVIPYSGYVGPNETNSRFESIGLYQLASSKAIHDFCNDLGASPNQREIIENYAGGIVELMMDIGRKLAKSMGLVDVGLFNRSWDTTLRLHNYNFSPNFIGSTGLITHSDSGFLTIVQDDEDVGGLQVMTKSGSFVAVDPRPVGSFLLNIGDVGKVWSNARWYNAKHRVECKEGNARVSMAAFLLGPTDAEIEAPRELVDDEHPRLFVPFTYQNYRKLRLTSPSPGTDETLSDFRAPTPVATRHHSSKNTL